MKRKHYWRSDMDYYEFLKVNIFYREEDPVEIFNKITLNYLNKKENV